MIARLLCAAGALALVMGAAQAMAQDGDDDENPPLIVQIKGPCTLTVAGRAQACQGLAYMVFPANQRKDFTVLTPDGGWAFSGETDSRKEGRYGLSVDSVLRPGAERLDAKGQCAMTVDGDGVTVSSLTCEATTSRGAVSLKASGVASTDDQDGDDDDDDDGGPDTGGQG